MLKITADKCGFPFVKIDEIGISVSFLPITKIQFEHFIADTNNPLVDLDSYYKFSEHNIRQAPQQMDISQYAGVFITDILPKEAQLFAQWMGYGYDLPTADEWKDIFDHFYAANAMPDLPEFINRTNGISLRATQIITNLESLTNQSQNQLLGDSRRVCDQMLMRLGIMEYVYENNFRTSFAGQGQPNRHFHSHARILPRDRAETLADRIRTTGARIKQYGFRLVHRG